MKKKNTCYFLCIETKKVTRENSLRPFFFGSFSFTWLVPLKRSPVTIHDYLFHPGLLKKSFADLRETLVRLCGKKKAIPQRITKFITK